MLPERFRIGDLDVDTRSNEIAGPGGTVALEPLVMSVLVCLARNSGKVVSREAIVAEVWNRPTTDQVLDRCISELRSALHDDARRPEYIKTYPKMGYKLLHEPVRTGGWRVLIVDDEDLIRHSFVLALREYDPEVECIEAGNCNDAMNDYPDERQPDHIFLDLGLPGVSGVEAIKLMREHFDAPVVVFSGAADRESIESALALGSDVVVGYMPKLMKYERLQPALNIIREGGRYVPEELFGSSGS